MRIKSLSNPLYCSFTLLFIALFLASSGFAASPVEERGKSLAAQSPSGAKAAADAAATKDLKQQFEKAKKGYYEPRLSGKGSYEKHWEPMPIQKYWDPVNFYEPPKSINVIAEAKDCLNCHKGVTPGLHAAWQKSAHANLAGLRKLKPGDRLYYKKEKIAEVENNLRAQGLLGKDAQLKEVGCIDCHAGVGVKKVDHTKNLKLPDRAACGSCHLKEFVESESEKELKWPQGQWPDGRPSHALDYRANVETAIWAGMPQRAIAQGCDSCHYNQNKCDGCHTRHTFSAVEARKPEACSMCHNGVDHNEFENYQLSKHGTQYLTQGSRWDWEVPLKDAISKGGLTSPTCAYCHFEYEGEFSHNLVRKVRWAFNPTPEIANNLNHEWFTKRADSWVRTCQNCHSKRFASEYLKTADQAIFAGIEKEQEAKKVVQALYNEGLLTGQKTNRPMPPAPTKDGPGDFLQLFWAQGNNPSAIEREYAEMWEHDLIKLYKGATHMNPGGYTYSHGWVPLLGRYAKIMDENTKIREMAALKKKLAGVEQTSNRLKASAVGFTGMGLLLAGGLILYHTTRKK